ncbi:hypothetical protein CMQ_8306 [Grosmannia clavigera kw1407]|uniref:Wd40 repeat-like protein n=1 Tax=Grosmannia clavigera (strain kw1407 / UAMH 11150) TaxID=655863 RepID=F0XKE9_GROCL|nr:uncharacterized protein CMQ_8306 [Grosmannia clavigera kw1407]EFX01840.1 hypothetical protein CMQ_8306 [Grosmannia clavigera kw1407]
MRTSALDGLWLLSLLAPAQSSALDFTVAGGQIFTPGFAIVDSPQPGTPLGGGKFFSSFSPPFISSPNLSDSLQLAIDVTADGRLNLPSQLAENSPSRIHNITIFLYSYDTSHNFTVSNGTASANNASLGPIMDQESGSTVKHINWVWPDCLVGDGQPTTTGSARGVYNISIRQSFRLNDVDHYTIFDLPVSVTNSIADTATRPSCDSLENLLLLPDQINATAADSVGILFAPGDATQVDVKTSNSLTTGDGLGPEKPHAKESNGLGSAASNLFPPSLAPWLCVAAVKIALLLL